MMKPRQSARGFTLMELLVVVGLVLVLAALVFPIVGKSRDTAQAVKCAANLKQIGVGLQNYIAENDGRLVPGSMLPSGWYWYHALDEYMGGTDTNWSSPTRPKWQLCPNHDVPIKTYVTIGYGWNYNNFGLDKDTPGKGYNSRLSEVTHPSQTMIIGDAVDVDVDPSPAGNFRYRNLSPFEGLHAKRHGGRGNYLMLDGHVESLPPDFDIKLMQKFK